MFALLNLYLFLHFLANVRDLGFEPEIKLRLNEKQTKIGMDV